MWFLSDGQTVQACSGDSTSEPETKKSSGKKGVKNRV